MFCSVFRLSSVITVLFSFFAISRLTLLFPFVAISFFPLFILFFFINSLRAHCSIQGLLVICTKPVLAHHQGEIYARRARIASARYASPVTVCSPSQRQSPACLAFLLAALPRAATHRKQAHTDARDESTCIFVSMKHTSMCIKKASDLASPLAPLHSDCDSTPTPLLRTDSLCSQRPHTDKHTQRRQTQRRQKISLPSA